MSTTTDTVDLDAIPDSAFSARLYEPFLWLGERLGMRDRRRRLLSQARGRVLEIGAGTGLNLEHYPPAATELVLAEPSGPMANRLRRRAVAAADAGRGPIQVSEASGEHLPFPDDSFDTVVATLVLCSVDDPKATLAEVARVLRPGGRLLLIEHVRSPQPRLARWQDRAAPAWRLVTGGCRCNRPTPDTLRAAGLEVERLEWGRMPKAVAVVRPMIEAVAVRAPSPSPA
jgi:SAM-dependent methyltransferase